MNLGTPDGCSAGREGLQVQTEASHLCPSFSGEGGGTRCSRHLFLTGREQMMVWMDIGKDLEFATILCLGARKGGDTFQGHRWLRIPRICP